MSQISNEPPFTLYKEHASEVLRKMRNILDRVVLSKSIQLKKAYLFQVDSAITWLILHHERVKNIIKSSSNKRWIALHNFIHSYSKHLGLSISPLPLFGERYYSSGSFQYYKGLALRLEKEYYLVAVDYTDPEVFWPLSIHEIVHCWLSKRDDVDQICSSHFSDIKKIDKDIAASRVEEVLCDIIATKVIGPAYGYAFINKLLSLFPMDVSIEYPSYSYRIECIASVLNAEGFLEEAADIREFGEQNFEKRWQDEDISWSHDVLLTIGNDLFSVESNNIESAARDASVDLRNSVPHDLPTLFYSAWLAIDNAPSTNISSTISSVSEIVLNNLKGSSISSYSHA